MFIVKPYSDELLSSWFMRLAKKNHTNISTLICHIFQNDILSNHTSKLHVKDMDIYPFNKNQKEMLFSVTNVWLDDFQLFKYNGFLNETIHRYKKLWIAEPKTKHFYGIRYCPKCLEEKPYIRQEWRILLYNICLVHNCYLKCECPSCNKKFIYYNNDFTREIYQCHHCGFDLRQGKVEEIKKIKYIGYQEQLINILNLGYYKINNRYYYSIGFFYLLKSLVLAIMKISNVKVKYIKELSPCHLSKYLSHVLFLLGHYPQRLNRFYKRNKLTDIHNILGWEDRNRQTWDLPSWYLSGIEYKVKTRKRANLKRNIDALTTTLNRDIEL